LHEMTPARPVVMVTPAMLLNSGRSYNSKCPPGASRPPGTSSCILAPLGVFRDADPVAKPAVVLRTTAGTLLATLGPLIYVLFVGCQPGSNAGTGLRTEIGPLNPTQELSFQIQTLHRANFSSKVLWSVSRRDSRPCCAPSNTEDCPVDGPHWAYAREPFMTRALIVRNNE